ncbi:MAG TPA: hypothetical protein VHH36_03480 [Candidatus Thermoplasmatota archaeon]|nr:hypothetical protein [Candidatus Thermoplasmatota archaeon]
MSRGRSGAALVAALLLLPAAHAGLEVARSREPDTPEDVADGFMRLAPDDDPNPLRRTVYFNAVPSLAAGSPGPVNPNVAPGMRLAPPRLAVAAYFGVWKDCNGDGYVGHRDAAMIAYPEPLTDRAVCGADSPHRRMGWVHELAWLRPATAPGNHDSVVGIADDGTAVWGDFGLPDEPPRVLCAAFPLPYGTSRTAAGVLQWLDCFTGNAALSAMNAADEDNRTGLRWDDPRQPQFQCGHPLNRELLEAHPWGCDRDRTAPLEKGDRKPAFEVWDCGKPKWQDVHDPTGDPGRPGMLDQQVGKVVRTEDAQGTIYAVPEPAPRADNLTTGSYADAKDALVKGVLWCGSRDVNHGIGITTTVKYEEDSPLPPFAGRRSSDLVLQWSSGAVGNVTNVPTQVPPDARGLVAPAANATPYGLGIDAVQAANRGGWSTPAAVDPPGYQTLVRDGLQPQPALRLTFYARLSPALAAHLALPPAPPEGYGAAAGCAIAEPGAGVSDKRWDCDPTRWWRPDLGVAEKPNVKTVPVVGLSYQFRDADCLDGQVAPGVHAGLAGVEGPCPAVEDSP